MNKNSDGLNLTEFFMLKVSVQNLGELVLPGNFHLCYAQNSLHNASVAGQRCIIVVGKHFWGDHICHIAHTQT